MSWRRVSERDVPESNHTIFMRGLPGSTTPDNVREFFEKEFGEITFDFVKVSPDKTKLYVAVRFTTKQLARECFDKYADADIMGHRCELTWFRDIRRYISHCQKMGIPLRGDRGNDHHGGRGGYNRGSGGHRGLVRSRSRTRSRSYHSSRERETKGSRSRSQTPGGRSRSRSVNVAEGRRSGVRVGRSPPSRSLTRSRSTGGGRSSAGSDRNHGKSVSPSPPPVKKSKKEKKRDKKKRKRHHSPSPTPSRSPSPPPKRGGGGGAVSDEMDTDQSEGEVVEKSPSKRFQIKKELIIGPTRPSPPPPTGGTPHSKSQQKSAVPPPAAYQQHAAAPVPVAQAATNYALKNSSLTIDLDSNRVPEQRLKQSYYEEQFSQRMANQTPTSAVASATQKGTFQPISQQQQLKENGIHGLSSGVVMSGGSAAPPIPAYLSNVGGVGGAGGKDGEQPVGAALTNFKSIQRDILKGVRYTPSAAEKCGAGGSLRLSALSKPAASELQREEKMAKLSPDLVERVERKKLEIELSYRKDCETYGFVAQKLICKDKNIDERIRMALLEVMKDLEAEAMTHLDDFIDDILSIMV